MTTNGRPLRVPGCVAGAMAVTGVIWAVVQTDVRAADRPAPEVAALIEAAVREAVPGTVTVRISNLVTPAATSPPDRAVPDPGARTGRTIRFALRAGDRRVGRAVAHVEVVASQVVAARAIARGAVLADGDVHAVDAPLEGALLQRLPVLDEVVGALARRQIAEGEVLTTAIVQVPPAVRSGDRVTVVVRRGAVVAESIGRASGTGYVGDVIRVSPWGGRDLRPARITATGAVEILP